MAVNTYMGLIRDPKAFNCNVSVPTDLKSGRDIVLFGNIKTIYEWHRDVFLPAIEECVTQPYILGELFEKYKSKLEKMYIEYCRNKPYSELLMSRNNAFFEEIRLKLRQKLQLCDILIKPVQRIMKYQLLMRDIFKCTERAGLEDEIEMLKLALAVTEDVPRMANAMMDVSRLRGFDGDITIQGNLLFHGDLQCILNLSDPPNEDYGPYKMQHVFLFEKCIIFSQEVRKKGTDTVLSYIYKAHIPANKINLKKKHHKVSDDLYDEIFIIKSSDFEGPVMWYVCYTPDPELRSEFWKKLRKIQETQQTFLKAILSPVTYQKSLAKLVQRNNKK